MVYTPFNGIPAVYERLADEPGAIIADLPLYPRRAIFGNTGAMLASTVHWHPILNGYSGFIPPSYQRALDALRGFPDDRALAALHALGVTHGDPPRRVHRPPGPSPSTTRSRTRTCSNRLRSRTRFRSIGYTNADSLTVNRRRFTVDC